MAEALDAGFNYLAVELWVTNLWLSCGWQLSSGSLFCSLFFKVFDWKENTSIQDKEGKVILDLLLVIYVFEEKIKAFQRGFFMVWRFSVHPPGEAIDK